MQVHQDAGGRCSRCARWKRQTSQPPHRSVAAIRISTRLSFSTSVWHRCGVWSSRVQRIREEKEILGNAASSSFNGSVLLVNVSSEWMSSWSDEDNMLSSLPGEEGG